MNNETMNSRRHHAPEDKVKILRQHLLEGRPISAVCEQHQINPTQFYQWQKIFFENGAAAFTKQPHSRFHRSGFQRKAALISASGGALPRRRHA